MRSIVVEGAFGLENLKVRQREVGAPGPGEVRLRMKAASLNYRDLLMVRGHYDPRQPLPLVPLSDGVGEVVEVGAGVTRVAVGDRVCPIFAQAWHAGEPRKETMRTTLGGPLDGTLREEMCLSEEGVVPVPEHLSDAEAACLPCAAVTAWSALVTHGGVKAGDTVLVLGTGGVAVFAVQFARLLGAEVIATSSSDEKLERVRALGAAHGINYVSEPDWGKRARALTGGRGVDHVLEVGGAGSLAQSLKAIRPGGHISLIGVLSGTAAKLNILPILMNNIRIQGILVGHRDSFEAMNRAISAHDLRPTVDRIFPFDDAKAAFEHLAAGAHFGKIVVRIG